MNNVTDIYPLLLTSAKKMTRDNNSAYELLHFTIEYISRKNIHIFDLPQGELFSYINRAMYLGYHSKTSPYHNTYRREIVGIEDNYLPSVDVFSNEIIRKENVDIALTRLAEHERVLFEAYIDDDFNYQEWADIAGTSVDYMYSYINYIKNKIRHYVIRIERNNQ